MIEKHKELQIPVSIIFDDKELEEIEVYRRKFAERLGVELSTEKFIARMLEVGSKPHLKRQMEFYVDGKIDGKDIRNI